MTESDSIFSIGKKFPFPILTFFVLVYHFGDGFVEMVKATAGKEMNGKK